MNTDEERRGTPEDFRRFDEAFRAGDIAALRAVLGNPDDFPNTILPVASIGSRGACLEYAIYHNSIAHLVRYHGILGPCASHRDRVVPAEPAPRVRRTGLSCPGPLPRASDRAAVPAVSAPAAGDPAALGDAARASPPFHAAAAVAPLAGVCNEGDPSSFARRARRLSWAQLAQRVFAIDVLVCPKCSGRMRIMATIHPPDATRAILECLGLPARAPPLMPARREEDDALSQAQPESDFFA